ncbi:hypothetical protein [Pseudomonas oryzihabitans]|uniref:hypothetical protein n=1 Tax=Pseudomonas oryzihabitans TaxID=47885 RepID=UPI0028957397|nr:hypothetical protein [Pseudomonas oryzihabitans]MDT3718459.1 hypothetical protein [Pseudomonas oryzihabitans]
MTRSFTEAQFKEELELAYDKGFGRGTGCNPSLIATEPYQHFREQELARPVKREAPAPRRPFGDMLGDIQGRRDEQ